MNSSYSKTRTSYRPSTHPRHKGNTNPRIKDIEISIIVTPAPTYNDLKLMVNSVNPTPVNPEEASDNLAWRQSLDLEIVRCRPLSSYMKARGVVQHCPTQHARIDPAQAEKLKDVLQPETLRRTFISMPELIEKIQLDIMKHK